MEKNRESGATLVLLEGKKEIRCISLSEKTTWTFGRETENNHPDIPVQSRIVSRRHGEFDSMDGEWFYIDGGSKNGTYHNGKKIEQGWRKTQRPVMLKDGDVLQIDSKDLDAPDTRGVRILFLTEYAGTKWKRINQRQLLKTVKKYDKKEKD